MFCRNLKIIDRPFVGITLKYHAMAIMIIATRIIQELIVHVIMAEKSRMVRARAVRMSSFEGGFMVFLLFLKRKN
jgi:hypothetical protein